MIRDKKKNHTSRIIQIGENEPDPVNVSQAATKGKLYG